VYNASCGGATTNVINFVPTNLCQAFTAITVPGLSVYQITKLSAGWLWTNLYFDSACATQVGSIYLQNAVCGNFNITVPVVGTVTSYLKVSFTANALTTGVIGSTTTGVATTAAATTGAAATTVVGVLPILLSLIATLFFA